jgi:hypothetical protein
MQATRNRFFLRLLMILLVITVGATVIAGGYFKDTLPAALAAFVKADDDADVTSPQLIALLIASIAMVASVVGMVGLWWCRRWARWVFTIPALTWPLLGGLVGFLEPTALVSNFIETMFNSAVDTINGAILALIWLGMSADFDR